MKTINISDELYTLITSMAEAMEEEIDSFVNNFITSNMKSTNQTRVEWLERSDAKEPGTGIFLIQDPSEKKSNLFVKKVIVEDIKYTEAVKRANTCQCVCFKWIPASFAKELKESSQTCGVSK